MVQHDKNASDRLLVIGGTPWLYDRARQIGLEIFLIQKPHLFRPEDARKVKWSLLIDYETDPLLLPLLRAAHQETPFATCLTLTESALSTAAKINAALGLPGIAPEVVEITRDKYKMRQRMEQHQFSPVRFQMGSNMEDLYDFAKENDFRILVKPHDGVGSRGILMIQNEQELQQITVEKLPSFPFLMEEYLEGPEYSVEAFSFHGQHVIAAVTEKTTLPKTHIEQAHRIPAVLSETALQTIQSHVLEFLSLIGVEDGPTHTELKLTPKGPRIIESHTRLGGDNIPDLVQLSTGVDLRMLTLEWFTGRTERIRSFGPAVGGAAIRYFTPPAGVMETLVGVEAARCQRGVVRIEFNVREGEKVPALTNSRDRIGFVITIGDSAEEASRLCEQVEQQVIISIREQGGASENDTTLQTR